MSVLVILNSKVSALTLLFKASIMSRKLIHVTNAVYKFIKSFHVKFFYESGRQV